MTFQNLKHLFSINAVILGAVIFQFTAANAQHPCDAFVNTCNIPSLAAWTVNDTISISTGQAGEPVAHTFYTTVQNPLTTNWYHWTAPNNGMVVANTLGTNPNAAPPSYQTPYVTDTVIAVYTGMTLGSLVRIDESDDWQPGSPPNSSCTHARPIPESIFSSCMMFTVTAGTTYHFQVDHLEIPTTPSNSNIVLNLYYRAPSSATVSVGGRITDSGGNGLAKVKVELRNSTGEIISAVTNPFGYYRIQHVDVGQTYVLSVSNKRFLFQNNPRVLSPSEDLSNEDFVGY